MSRRRSRNFCRVIGVLGLLPMVGLGQTGNRTLTVSGHVSETIALSVASGFSHDNLRIDMDGDRALRVTLSAESPDSLVVRVPILIRSNTSYQISASLNCDSATLSSFAVLEARPTGKFASTEAATNLRVPQEIDRRTAGVENSFEPSYLFAFSILSGARTSLAGTLHSPDNALEVTFSIGVRPQPAARRWVLSLTLTASPANRS